MSLMPIVPPVSAAVTLAEAKAFLRLGHASDDTLVTALISAAEAHLESAFDLALIERTLQWNVGAGDARALWASGLTLPRWPILRLSVVQIMGRKTNIITPHVVLKGRRVMLVPGAPDSAVPGALGVIFTAGFGPAYLVPSDLKLAVLELVAARFEARGEGDVSNAEFGLPNAVRTLVQPYLELRL